MCPLHPPAVFLFSLRNRGGHTHTHTPFLEKQHLHSCFGGCLGGRGRGKQALEDGRESVLARLERVFFFFFSGGGGGHG